MIGLKKKIAKFDPRSHSNKREMSLRVAGAFDTVLFLPNSPDAD